MKNPKKYKAFSLIELVFTIVVLGIIATAITSLLEITPNVAKLKQMDKIFYGEFTLGSLIITRYFDENNTQVDNYYKDLNSTNGDSELLLNYVVDGNPERIGKYLLKNQCRDGAKEFQNVSEIGLDSGETQDDLTTLDDVDDFNGYEINLTVDNYPAEVNISYISDETNYSAQNVYINLTSNSVSSSNIKLIKITGYYPNKNGDKIVYYIPVFNIGATKYLSKQDLGQKCE